jgi:starch synthase (maltosyl-transferring)
MVDGPLDHMGIGEHDPFDVVDLLNGLRYEWRGRKNYVRLDPAERVAHVFRVTKRR